MNLYTLLALTVLFLPFNCKRREQFCWNI